MKLIALLLKIALIQCETPTHYERYITWSNDLPKEDTEMIIPKIFHTIWIDFGKGDIFPKYIENMRQLQVLHLDWELKLWREPEIVELIKKEHPEFLEIFESYDIPIKKHDAGRAVILYNFGGVYVDHDFIPFKNIEPLLKSYSFVVANGLSHFLDPANGVMAAVKKFELFSLYIQMMNDPLEAKKGVVEATGPGMLKKVIEKYVQQNTNKGCKVYGRTYFYPFDFSNEDYERDLSVEQLKAKHPNCYLFHYYDFTWENQNAEDYKKLKLGSF